MFSSSSAEVSGDRAARDRDGVSVSLGSDVPSAEFVVKHSSVELCDHILRGCVERVELTQSNLPVQELGPRAAQRRLCMELTSSHAKSLWMVDAEVRAILGGMQGSLKSLASGLRCYIAFVGTGRGTCVCTVFDLVACVQLTCTRTSSASSRLLARFCWRGLPFSVAGARSIII